MTNVRAGVTARESIRRAEEQSKVQLWENRELQELMASKSVDAQIEQCWQKVAKLSSPYHLDAVLSEQKKACGELLKIKDDLIADYVAELKVKDDEYVRELKRQTEEIGLIINKLIIKISSSTEWMFNSKAIKLH